MRDRSPSWLDPMRALGFVAVALACLAAPRTAAPVALALPVAVLLGALLLRRRHAAGSDAGARVETQSAWQAAVVLSHLTFRAAPGLSSVSLGLECASVAGAAVLLPGRGALVVAASVVALEGTAAAWLLVFRPETSDVSAGLPARLFVPLAVTGAVWYLSERQRRTRGRLESRLRSLTGEDALPPDAPGLEDPSPRASGRSGDLPRAERPGASGEAASGSTAGPRADLGRLLEIARRGLRARTCVLFERADDPPRWRITAAASTADDFDGLATAPLGHGLIAWAAKHEVPFRVVEPGPQLRALPWYAGDSSVGSFVAVPLPRDPGEEDDLGGSGVTAVLACDSPLARQFDPDAEDLLLIHAEEIAGRLAASRRLAMLGFERAATRALPRAVAAVTEVRGSEAVAQRLLECARALADAPVGAVLVAEGGLVPSDAAAAEDGADPARRRMRVAASAGLDEAAASEAGVEEETWAGWAARHPDSPVRLAAYAADRGMPRIVRGDGLDASLAFASFALVAPQGALGSLSLAWPLRHLPASAVLEAIDVLARVGGATLLREQAEERLARGRALDGLTGLPGRTALLLAGAEAFAAAQGAGTRLSVAWFDLDASGELNARGGPAAWDAAVEALGRTLVAALPSLARVHRWQGDAFVALLPGTGEEGVMVAARRATAAVAQGALAGHRLTVTAGVATLADGDGSFDGLLARASEGLALAKAAGVGKVKPGPR